MTETTDPYAGWHADGDLLVAYLGDRLPPARSSSVEQHLLACPRCQRALGAEAAADAGARTDLDGMWSEVLDTIDRPRAPWAERVLARIGAPDSLVRVALAAPALRVAWAVSLTSTLLFALLASSQQIGAGDAAWFIASPLLPLAAIAVTYSAVTDPATEIVSATPFPTSRLFLLRAVAVLSVAFGAALGASLVVPASAVPTLAWLLPALALTSVVLAASTWIAPAFAAATAAGGWLALMVGQAVATRGLPGPRLGHLGAFQTSGQIVAAVVVVGATAVFVARMDQLDRPRPTTSGGVR